MAEFGVQALRSHGLRVTGPRLAVLQVLAADGHLSAEAVAAAARHRVGSVSTQGVYTVLADLVAAGLVHRIEPAGSPALYEIQHEETHHHLVCRSCAAVVDLPCDHDLKSCLVPPATHGFADLEAEIVFWGTCPACQAAIGRADEARPRRRSS
ncbi:MAG: transcriptional repressor [Actinomycetia bacterium]|jgi:Fur family ferric uptake transcriptional regulator|nr:transcriptional repressor [Actinomycetes bacterium]